jgi:hypothetical protein
LSAQEKTDDGDLGEDSAITMSDDHNTAILLRPPAKLDYSLTGEESKRAIDALTAFSLQMPHNQRWMPSRRKN